MAKTWFVTGGSRGLGLAIVQAVLAHGDNAVSTSRSVSTLGEKAHSNLLSVALDVTKPETIIPAVDQALARFGRIDVLVNNAGFGLLGAVEETNVTEIERVYATNVFGLLNVARAVLPVMRAQRAGHVFNISSVGGFAGTPGWGIYNSTKFAVEGMSEALAVELAPLGVRVTIVEPGYFRTDFLDSSSVLKTANRIADYDKAVGPMRESAQARNHAQPGDPAKLAAALIQVSDSEYPPLRLPMGTDCVARIEQKLESVAREINHWRALSVSTDHN
jgi:NAD(P)-dependent dehydrogenase (short-subunit alcohol dehydrogenase family)